MHRRLTPLLLLSVLLIPSHGCSKDVQEAKNKPYGQRSQEARRKDVPVAPRGEPVGITAAPTTP
jgi:hypothetical protein